MTCYEMHCHPQNVTSLVNCHICNLPSTIFAISDPQHREFDGSSVLDLKGSLVFAASDLVHVILIDVYRATASEADV